MVVTLKKMKQREVMGIDDILIEVWTVLGETSITCLTNFFNKNLKMKKRPNEWQESTLVPIYNS